MVTLKVLLNAMRTISEVMVIEFGATKGKRFWSFMLL